MPVSNAFNLALSLPGKPFKNIFASKDKTVNLLNPVSERLLNRAGSLMKIQGLSYSVTETLLLILRYTIASTPHLVTI